MGKENMMGARLWFIWPVLIADWWRLNATHASWEEMYPTVVVIYGTHVH
jgi:hypothetical protein